MRSWCSTSAQAENIFSLSSKHEDVVLLPPAQVAPWIGRAYVPNSGFTTRPESGPGSRAGI